MASRNEHIKENSENPTTRRRQHHLRSKNGCATCKERHIRCDERSPFCRNCVRVGRVCIYAGISTPQSSISPEPEALVAVPGPSTHPAWQRVIFPPRRGVHNPQPRKQDIATIALWIVQQSYQISTGRQLPERSKMSTPRDDLLQYNQLAEIHGCVQCALMSFHAYIQYQTTKSSASKEVYLSHSCIALTKLQNEINNFSPVNADAIVISSIILAGQAQDWDQWVIFMEGYSMALKQIRDRNIPTTYPDLLGEHFQLQSDSSGAIFAASEPSINRKVMHQNAEEVLNSIQTTAPLLGPEKWQNLGFWDLEQLALTVVEAIRLESDSESYHKLAWLRSWMFWIESRESKDEEQPVLSCLFYALISATVPLFPARYSNTLAPRCADRMESMIAEMADQSPVKPGLLSLFNSTERGYMKQADWPREAV